MKLPEGHQQVIPYLVIRNAEQFYGFAQQAFGAVEKMRVYDEETKVFKHGEISIGGSVIMFGQTNDNWGTQNAGLFIYVENADDSYQKSIDAGAKEVLPLSDQSYGRTCGVEDPFGNTWWITSVQ
ncbi:putative glyoxalase superfamily protein PhnB [Chitinophaga polysaccharea]|uniref:Putative glyoxalase superfamily protein PhnB n=1 Tax=Chitinophaga polysaccharea TaxID=1293035 RepID=A0A561PUA2_9BACT|nr:VOC family protein [Chitinophaga polysaccharea]TWF41677.1 putative glyoxalase superfamily protein PhnB [Chitinophaga polysaccharea]